MSRVATVVQARMGSTRLPGKVLADVAGEPLLNHVVRRARAIPGSDTVILATTSLPEDQQLVALAKELGLPVYAGSVDDVLDRYYQAARLFSTEVLIRVTADCPLLDPIVSGTVLTRYWEADVDYVSNAHPPTFPDGLDTEVFSFHALECAWREARLRSEREHVTPYLWKQPDKFRLANVSNPVDLSQLRWTVDEMDDLQFVRAVYGRLQQEIKGIALMKDVLDLLSREPSLRDVNSRYSRDEGYAKSLTDDGVIS